MALFNKPGLSITVESAATITANKFVTLGGALPATPANAAGVVLNGAVSGDSMTVHLEGIVLVTVGAGGATAGAVAEVLAAGTVQDYTSGTKVGRFLSTASAGELASVLLGAGVGTAGSGVIAKGIATLNGSTPVSITCAAVAANDAILVGRQVAAGTPGHFGVGTITAGASFTVVGAASDTSTVAWAIVR